MILRHRRAFDDYRDCHERESLDGVELIGTVFAALCIFAAPFVAWMIWEVLR